MRLSRSAIRALEAVGGSRDGACVHLPRTGMHLVARVVRSTESMNDPGPDGIPEPSDSSTHDLAVYVSLDRATAEAGQHLWHYSQRAQAHLPYSYPHPDHGYRTRSGLARDVIRITAPWLQSIRDPRDLIDQLEHQKVAPSATYGWTAPRAIRDRLRLARAFALPDAFTAAAEDADALLSMLDAEGDDESSHEIRQLLHEQGLA